MTCLTNEHMSLCGNFSELSREKPKSHDEAYKILIRYEDLPKGLQRKRPKLGKATCDCVEVEEHYQPWYGFSWYHGKECAIMKHIKRYPGITNFFWDGPGPECIGMTD